MIATEPATCNRRNVFRTLSVLSIILLTSANPFLCPASPCPEFSAAKAKARLAHLVKEIKFHNDLYYKSARPVLTDQQYDQLFHELVELELCFPQFAAADSPTHKVPSDAGKEALSLRHQSPMLSLTSSIGPEAVQSLLSRAMRVGSRPKLLIQPKVDGLPVELVYQEGRLVSAATRGDGRLGADVTKRVKEITGIPHQLSGRFPPRVTVRGEVYADRRLMAVARESLKEYATPRHFAAATLKSQHPDPLAVTALRLFPFQLLDADLGCGVTSDQAALELLSLWGFPVRLDLTHAAQGMDEIGLAYRKTLAGRGESPFAADGIVVKIDDLLLRRQLGEGSRAPFWAAAWKFPPETTMTVVREIRWNSGRTGRRTPVAEVVPVHLGGVRISRVSLNNAETVRRLGLSPGDRVVIALVADIIPQIVEVNKADAAATSTDATSTDATSTNATSTNATSTNATSTDAPKQEQGLCLSDTPGCRDKFLARAVHFTSKAGLDISGLGPKRLRLLIEARLVRDLPSLFRLKQHELAAVHGFGPESARRLAAELRRAERPEPFRLLAALGIPGVGPTTAKRLAKRLDSLEALLLLEADGTADEPALQKVFGFFGSPEGQELLKGLREVNLL
jgi:DNA ligase (NAD+)